MKKIVKIFVFSSLIFSLSSCKDWLQVDLEDNQSMDDYWKNKEEVEAVVMAGYYNLRKDVSKLLHWGEARGFALNIHSSDKATNKALAKLRNITVTPSDDTFLDWGTIYTAISRANLVIARAPGVAEVDDTFYPATLNSMLAEAYFIRNLAYFYLVRTFQDVPYILEPYETDDQSFDFECSTQDYILRAIADELEMVLEEGLARDVYEEDSAYPNANSKGRATTNAIRALLADVYLWLGEWDKCIAFCDEIIQSGRVGMIQGEDWFLNFADYDSNGGNTNESIFELQFREAWSETGSVLTAFRATSEDVVYGLTDEVTNGIISSWIDVRTSGTRRDYYYTTSGGSIVEIFKRVGKDYESGGVREANDQNYIIYRLAEIYLMKAEAYAMKDLFTLAVDNINIVRERAEALPVTTTFTDREDLLRYILEERTREFAAEGKCWFDMVRIGRHNNYSYKNILIDYYMIGVGAANAGSVRSKLSDTNSWYLPISASEMEKNSLLTQNPYYESLGK